MFKNFETKVKFILHSVIIIILSVSVIFIYCSMKKIYTGEYINKTRELSVQYNQRSDYYIDDYEKRVRQIATNPIVEETVCQGINNPELNSVLTELSQAYDDILGVSVYSGDYAYFSDKVIGAAPDFSFIRNNYIMPEFENSQSEICWVVRTPESYKDYYQRSSYTSCDSGLYTCIYKIKDDFGVCRGYLLLDTNIKKIFELYAKDNEFMKKMDLYIDGSEKTIVGYTNNKGKAETGLIKNTAESSLVYKNYVYMFYPLRNSENRLVMCISTKGIFETMKIIMTLVIITAAMFYLLGIVMGNRLVKGITEPILRLRKKIMEYNFDEE